MTSQQLLAPFTAAVLSVGLSACGGEPKFHPCTNTAGVMLGGNGIFFSTPNNACITKEIAGNIVAHTDDIDSQAAAWNTLIETDPAFKKGVEEAVRAALEKHKVKCQVERVDIINGEYKIRFGSCVSIKAPDAPVPSAPAAPGVPVGYMMRYGIERPPTFSSAFA